MEESLNEKIINIAIKNKINFNKKLLQNIINFYINKIKIYFQKYEWLNIYIDNEFYLILDILMFNKIQKIIFHSDKSIEECKIICKKEICICLIKIMKTTIIRQKSYFRISLN